MTVAPAGGAVGLAGPSAIDSGDLPTAPDAGRTSEFGTGAGVYSSDHASVHEEHPAMPSLPFHANGVLQLFQRSGVGMSVQDPARRFAGRDTPGQSFNSAASQQQEALQDLRAIGDTNA
jgi:hypothetical protein